MFKPRNRLSFITFAITWRYYKDKDKDPFISPQEFVVGYSKAPEQPQSSARPICHSHTMTSMGREPATIRIAAYRSSLCYMPICAIRIIIMFTRGGHIHAHYAVTPAHEHHVSALHRHGHLLEACLFMFRLSVGVLITARSPWEILMVITLLFQPQLMNTTL